MINVCGVTDWDIEVDQSSLPFQGQYLVALQIPASEILRCMKRTKENPAIVNFRRRVAFLTTTGELMDDIISDHAASCKARSVGSRFGRMNIVSSGLRHASKFGGVVSWENGRATVHRGQEREVNGGSSLAFADLYRLHNEKGDKRIEIDSHFPSSLTAPRAFSEVSWRSNRTIAAQRVTTLWSIAIK